MVWCLVRWQMNTVHSEGLPAPVVHVEAVRDDSGGGRSVHCNVVTLYPSTDPCYSSNYQHCHYSVDQSSPLVCAPNKTMQTHNLPFLFSIVCFNAFLLSTPKFTVSSFFLVFQFNFLLIFFPSLSCFDCLLFLDFITITFVEQFKLWSYPLCTFLFVSCYFFPLKEKLSPQHSISQLCRSMFCCKCGRPVAVPYRTRCNIIVFTFIDVRKGKWSWAWW